MRIIGGEWRGRKIEEPRGRDVTRPTTDRVREACASMVMSAFDFDLDEVRVLDAFGGSGALGIEMLSAWRPHAHHVRDRSQRCSSDYQEYSVALPRPCALARGDGRRADKRLARPRAGRSL